MKAKNKNLVIFYFLLGEVFVWGSNTEGQLGLGEDSVETITSPTLLPLDDFLGKNDKVVVIVNMGLKIKRIHSFR